MIESIETAGGINSQFDKYNFHFHFLIHLIIFFVFCLIVIKLILLKLGILVTMLGFFIAYPTMNMFIS